MPEQYLRKYQVLVSNDAGTALDVSDLKCTFTIEKKAIQAINYGDITIYNLSGPTEAAIIKEGHRVIVNAGYVDGAFGKIFDGRVFQPLWDRENVTDYKLTLHCIDGDSFLHQNFVSFSMAAGYNYKSVITSMAQNARVKIPIGGVSENISDKQSPRGKVIFGDPKSVFRHMAQDNGAQVYVNDGELQVMKLTDPPSGEILTITPQTGLIGTPQQIDYGFSFRCLINPNIKIKNPPMMVKLDNTMIRQQKAITGQMISMLDQTMQGQVIGITYTGDTRGVPWYMDIVCVSSWGKMPLMLSGSMVNPL